MDHQEQPSRAVAARVEPDRPHHVTRLRIEAGPGRAGMLGDDRAKRRLLGRLVAGFAGRRIGLLVNRPGCRLPDRRIGRLVARPAGRRIGAADSAGRRIGRLVGRRIGCRIKCGRVDSDKPGRHVHRAWGGHPQRPPLGAVPTGGGPGAGPLQAGPQHVVPVRHGLEHGPEPGLVQSRGGLQECRLVVAPERAAALPQGVHDRGQRDRARTLVRPASGVRARRDGDGGQGRDRAVLEDLARSDPQARRAGPADQLHRDDAVTAEGEEIVVGAGLGYAEHLGDDRGEGTFDVARGLASTGGREVRRRERPAVELAVGQQRQSLQDHHRRRDHVVRQDRRRERPQSGRVRGIGSPGRVSRDPFSAGSGSPRCRRAEERRMRSRSGEETRSPRTGPRRRPVA